ncbi:arabinogalactan oligomer/maltooligosaccharide transport system permease protein [Acholeplasma morum]|uniref:carbohydrate ABC transporter permease n=1 Tax=Paracholeplasma morum TaxID=264637 RepID=UPI001956A8EC|nr:sugar ABC transporter permease [Paracholeplasma morum]MBM7453163.1 arabinogalactan oligomer/maltooligosaccharide transport system permease protein [Paracholeplasma morum]
MKVISILKAIASGIIWGLGQLLNGQFIKALILFLVFSLFIGIELGTSHYNVETSAYDKLPGDDFGDTWVSGQFVTKYNDLVFRNEIQPYTDFENYVTEIGGYDNLTEMALIEFIARDLVKNNPASYKDINNPNVLIKAEDFENPEQNVEIDRSRTIYKDEDGIYYLERNKTLEDGTSTKEYVKVHFITNVVDESVILDSLEGLTVFRKTGEIYRLNGIPYLKVIDNDSNKYVNLYDFTIGTLPSTPTKVNVVGPLYLNNNNVYEYYQPGLIYLGEYLQYQPTQFTTAVRAALRDGIYANPANRRDSNDFTRFMLKVYLHMNPETKASFEDNYDYFFYDKAGIFIKGYWSVLTLGVAKKVEFSQYNSLESALVGGPTAAYSLSTYVTPLGSVPLKGHISTILMLQGLIAIILSLFFMIFMVWSIRDAYIVAEQKRLKKEVTKQGKYFKEVYENFFEYIILSPAMFVLAFISIMPITFGFIMAFTSISGPTSMIETFDWIGLKNFIALFDFSSGFGASFGQAFWRVLGWTFIWAILSTFTVFFGGFLQALILNSEKVVFRKLWRTIMILPWAIPALLSQMVFSVMFKDNGFVNTFLRDIGIYEILTNLGMLGKEGKYLEGFQRLIYLGKDNIQWFSNPFNPTFVRATLVVVNIWLGFPYFMALMTGIMTAIDKTLYEAADIDGATGIQKITKITMPLVLYSTAPILIMTFSGNFNNFGVIYFITQGGPNAGNFSRGFAGDTDILISWMYKLTVDESIYNMASVFSVLIFLFVGSISAWNLSRTKAFQED